MIKQLINWFFAKKPKRIELIFELKEGESLKASTLKHHLSKVDEYKFKDVGFFYRKISITLARKASNSNNQ